MIKETFKARSYSPELITGRYVRENKAGGYLVIESSTCMKKGPFYGQLGMGPTLREYITDGEEIPQSVKDDLELVTHCHPIAF